MMIASPSGDGPVYKEFLMVPNLQQTSVWVDLPHLPADISLTVDASSSSVHIEADGSVQYPFVHESDTRGS